MQITSPSLSIMDEQILTKLAQEQYLVVINWDVNKTLILTDSCKTSNDLNELIISILAENTFDIWESGLEMMSFQDYIYKIIHPENKLNPPLKNDRRQKISEFLVYLEKTRNVFFPSVLEKYHAIREKYLSPTNERESGVFSSFYCTLNKLRELNIPFKIILRTFGKDLDDTIEKIESHPEGINFRQVGKFSKQKLKLDSDEVIETTEEIFRRIISSVDHFAIKDSYKTWNNGGKQSSFGKPFIYDSSNDFEGVRNLSIFFDDNITHRKEDDIIAHVDLNPEPPKGLGPRAFKVDTSEALLNHNYYLGLIALAARDLV